VRKWTMPPRPVRAMLDGRFDQHFVEVFARSQASGERRSSLAIWLVLALWAAGAAAACVALFG
jgi:hypothetical protein